MHEMSIVEALMKQCEVIAKENNAKKVLNIYLKIGILSGVEIHFLKSTFDAFKKGTICQEAVLHTNLQKIVVLCKDCKKTSTLQKHEFICPNCDSIEIKVIDGEDMMLMKLEME